MLGCKGLRCAVGGRCVGAPLRSPEIASLSTGGPCLSLWERWPSEECSQFNFIAQKACKPLSVTSGDSSPKGRAKGGVEPRPYECHSEPVTDVGTLRKHAGGMFLVPIAAAISCCGAHNFAAAFKPPKF